MNDKPQQGGCQCGAVRYRTSDTPVLAMACHCSACKLRTGSAFGIGVYLHEDDTEFTGGELGTYQYLSDTSGRWIKREFCSNCGTTVSWTLEMRPGLRAIAGGTYDDPDWYQIQAHIWTSSARSDACFAEGMPTFEQARI